MRRIETTECDGAEWFPDGKRILCTISNPNGRFRLVALELPSGRATEIPIADDAAADLDHGGPISPDGAFLLGGGSRRGYLDRAARGRSVSPNHRRRPSRSRSDGRRTGGSSSCSAKARFPKRIQKLDLATGRVEPWKELTLEDLAGVVRIDPVRVAPDGRSWAYSYIRVLSNLYVVEGLR